MKKHLAWLLALVLMFFVTGCGAERSDAKDGITGAEGWAQDWGITLSVRDVTSAGLTLICTQSGGIAEGSLETGSEYRIEKNENGNWVEVKTLCEACWDMMAYLIPSDTDTEWTVDWSWLYGELSAGRYRISKTIVDFKESGGSRSQIYFAEFEITA